MFASSRAGFRAPAVSAGMALSLALASTQALAQAAPEVVPRAAMTLELPVAPFIPYNKVLSPAIKGAPVETTAVALTAGPEPSAAREPSPTRSASAKGNSASLPMGPWEVKTSDVTLYRTLERWSQAAGYKLKWDAARNFLIGAPDIYVGTFESALQSVLSSAGIRLSDYPLEACIYANTPPLVRITRQGEQARECSAIE